jgi:hypothetical protein
MTKKLYRDKITRQRIEKETTATQPESIRRSRFIGMKKGPVSSTKPMMKLKQDRVVDENKYNYQKQQNHLDVTKTETKKKELKYV